LPRCLNFLVFFRFKLNSCICKAVNTTASCTGCVSVQLPTTRRGLSYLSKRTLKQLHPQYNTTNFTDPVTAAYRSTVQRIISRVSATEHGIIGMYLASVASEPRQYELRWHTWAKFQHPLSETMLFVWVLNFSRRNFCGLLWCDAE
jgi:hypothetical protein